MITIGLLILLLTTATIGQSASLTSSNSAKSSDSSKSYLRYNAIEFENIGFESYYYNVEELSNPDSEDCSCTVSSELTKFSGTNAPLNEEVSVHFRGPLILSKFAYYVADHFVIDEDTSSSWERLLYYDSASQTAENVTFLTNAGTNSTCLGKALTYAADDGVSKLSDSTILADNTLINSDEEYKIFTNISCEDSGYSNDCGVYRDGIPAYHGYYGVTKMFLFEFKMPTESKLKNSTSLTYFDMPAIWLLNAHIPRTSQYPANESCSCWSSGCGEFDIFEVLNGTENNHLYSTIHDYQGTGIIAEGLQADGFIERDTVNTMKGGVVFDSNGTAYVFLSNDTSIDSVVSGTDLQDWISSIDDVVEDELQSIAPNTGPASSSSSSSSSSKNGDSGSFSGLLYQSTPMFIFMTALNVVLFIL